MQKYRHLFLMFSIAVLAAGLIWVQARDRKLGLQRIPPLLSYNHKHLKAIAQHLRQYQKATGHYPSNDQGLLVVDNLVRDSTTYSATADYAKTRYLRASNSGIITLWGEPFIYENREGFPASAFADSEATRDTEQKYSIKVDNGVYVWSIAADQQYHKYKVWILRLRILFAAVIAASLILLATYIWYTWKATGGKFWRSILWSTAKAVLGLLAVTFLVFPIFVRTCYAMSTTRLRTPELTHDYITLITKYHNRGVISDKAYKKIINNMKSSPL